MTDVSELRLVVTTSDYDDGGALLPRHASGWTNSRCGNRPAGT